MDELAARREARHTCARKGCGTRLDRVLVRAGIDTHITCATDEQFPALNHKLAQHRERKGGAA